MSPRSAAPVRGAVALFAVGLLVVAGCNKPVGTVSGKVTYQGKALKGGGVTFVSANGDRSFVGPIGPDGSYKVPDIVGGTYKVTVDNSSLKGQEKMGGTAAPPPLVPKGAKGGPPPGANLPEGYVASDPNAMKAVASGANYTAINPKYLKAETTDIEYTFKGGDDTFNVELK
ncbi:MAG TPA: hypothetical protein VD866_09075 [Urbifossiella sp.]|nr:hypothetical protein [Urbifossiella sp.]